MVESRVCDDKDHQDDDSKARGTLKDVSESNEHQQELQEKDSRPHRFAGKIRAWWLRKTRRKLERPRVSAPISIPADNPFAGPLPEGHTIPVRRKQHEDIDPPAEAQSGYFSREEVLQGSAYRDVVSWMLPERIPDPEPTWEESADDSGRQFMLDPLEYERVRRDYGRSVLIRQFVEKAVNHGVTLEQAEDFKREMGISPAEYEAICRNYARTVRLRCFVETAAWHGVAPEYAELFARENNVTVSERKQMQADIARLIEERERQEAQFEPNPSYLPSISIAPLGEPLRGRSNNIFHAKTNSAVGFTPSRSSHEAPFSPAGPSNPRPKEGGHNYHLPLRGGAGEAVEAEDSMPEWPSNRSLISLIYGFCLVWIAFAFLVHLDSDTVPQLAPDDAYLSYYDVRLTKEDVDSIKKGDWLTDNVRLHQLHIIPSNLIQHYRQFPFGKNTLNTPSSRASPMPTSTSCGPPCHSCSTSHPIQPHSKTPFPTSPKPHTSSYPLTTTQTRLYPKAARTGRSSSSQSSTA